MLWISDKFKDIPLRDQGFSKVEDPGQGLVRVRGKAPTLASDMRNLVHIDQGKRDEVSHGQHLRHWREADSAPILPQGGIAAPVEPKSRRR